MRPRCQSRGSIRLSGSSEGEHLKAAVNWALLIAVSLALAACAPGPAPQAMITPTASLPTATIQTKGLPLSK
jgi:hypothetical protein